MSRRLITARMQTFLVKENMLNLLNFLKKQAKDNKIAIMQTSNKTKIEVLPDFETILKSVKKTNRAIVVYSGSKTNGSGAEIAARHAEKGFQYLKKPLIRIAGRDVPIPFAPKLEKFVTPQEKDIRDAVIKLLK